VLGPSPAALATAAGRRRRPLDVFRSMGRSWALINSSSLFRRLALCMAVVGIVSEVRAWGRWLGMWCYALIRDCF
jgi:phosphatidylglycerophosphate synthase